MMGMLKKYIFFLLISGVASNSFGMTEGRVAQICTDIIKKTGNSVNWGKVASAGITQVCGASAFCFKAAWNQFGFSLIPTAACVGLI